MTEAVRKKLYGGIAAIVLLGSIFAVHDGLTGNRYLGKWWTIGQDASSIPDMVAWAESAVSGALSDGDDAPRRRVNSDTFVMSALGPCVGKDRYACQLALNTRPLSSRATAVASREFFAGPGAEEGAVRDQSDGRLPMREIQLGQVPAAKNVVPDIQIAMVGTMPGPGLVLPFPAGGGGGFINGGGGSPVLPVNMTGPDGPGVPDTPGAPGSPGDPADPDGPVGPGDPDGPVKPLSPDGPSGPGNPDGPVGPLNPDGPGGPGNPDGPVGPVRPDVPDIPIGPVTPVPAPPGFALLALGLFTLHNLRCRHFR